jgi:hypothetical protein
VPWHKLGIHFLYISVEANALVFTKIDNRKGSRKIKKNTRDVPDMSGWGQPACPRI